MHPAAPRHRSFGGLMLVSSICWSAMLVLAVVGFGSAFITMMYGVSAVITPSEGTAESIRTMTAVTSAIAVGALALALITLVLDVVVTVMALRRLNGRRGDRSVPILGLVAVALSTALPLVLAAFAVLASFLDLTQVTSAILWLLTGVLLVLSPWARMGQMIGGIIRLVSGEGEDVSSSDRRPLP